MMRISLLCLAMIFMAGCVAVHHQHDTFGIVNGKAVLLERNITKYGSACVNIKTGMLIADVNDEFKLLIIKRDLIADPNSLKAIGEAFGKGFKAFIVP